VRIVFVIERISNVGGLERILVEKMNYLVENTSHEVILMTVWCDTKQAAYAISDKVKRIDLNVQLSYTGLPIATLWALHRFNKETKRIMPDIVVLTRAVGAFLASFASWNGRKIYESHVPLKYMNHQWLYPLMLRKNTEVVCLTHGDADDFTSMCSKQGCSPLVEVIPNFTGIVTQQQSNYNSKVVVAAGRKCYEKNFERLKNLWSKVEKNYPDWQMKIHHETKDMVSAYLEGSVFVMTSRFEGFGMVLIEAMSCGLPCIAFDCPYGPRDIIEDGKTGYLIPYDDDDMFVKKLTYLMEHPEVREQMGRAAKESVKRFSEELVMKKWKQFYESLPY